MSKYHRPSSANDDVYRLVALMARAYLSAAALHASDEPGRLVMVCRYEVSRGRLCAGTDDVPFLPQPVDLLLYGADAWEARSFA